MLTERLTTQGIPVYTDSRQESGVNQARIYNFTPKNPRNIVPLKTEPTEKYYIFFINVTLL